MELIQGFGLLFPVEYSSCSNLPPKFFNWTTEDTAFKIYIDDWIKRGLNNPYSDTKFGWLCESRGIATNVYNDIINDYKKYKLSYKNIFTCDYSLINIDPNFFIYNPPGSNLPWTKFNDIKIYNKSKICSMIASAKTHTYGHHYRLEIAKKYHSQLDLYGGANGSQRIGDGIGPNGDWWRSKSSALNEYMFSIVMENAVYDKYYTEKITDAFATGTVPVYWGTRKITEDFNSEGIIFLDDIDNLEILTPMLYQSMLPAINDNLERVKKLLSSEDMIYQKIVK